jgi:hypothetical protein
MTNLKILAFLGTLKIVVIGIMVYAGGVFIAKNFTVDEISTGISCISTVFLLYLIFDLKLNQLKHEASIKEMSDRYNTKS